MLPKTPLVLEFRFLFYIAGPARKRNKRFRAFYQICGYKFYVGTGRPVVAPRNQLLDGEFVALRDRFYAAVVTISHPSVDLQRLRDRAHRFTKTHPLHAAGDRYLYGNVLTVAIHSS